MNREEYAQYFNSKLPDELKKYLIIDNPDELKDFEKACPEVTKDGYTYDTRIYLALISWLKQQKPKHKETKQKSTLGLYKTVRVQILPKKAIVDNKATSQQETNFFFQPFLQHNEKLLSMRHIQTDQSSIEKETTFYIAKPLKRYTYFPLEAFITELLNLGLDSAQPNLSEKELEGLINLIREYGTKIISSPQYNDKELDYFFQLKREIIIFKNISLLHQQYASFPNENKARQIPDYITQARFLTSLQTVNDYATQFNNKVLQVKTGELEQVRVSAKRPQETITPIDSLSVSILDLAYWKLWEQMTKHEQYLKCGFCQEWHLKGNNSKYCSFACQNSANQAEYRRRQQFKNKS